MCQALICRECRHPCLRVTIAMAKRISPRMTRKNANKISYFLFASFRVVRGQNSSAKNGADDRCNKSKKFFFASFRVFRGQDSSAKNGADDRSNKVKNSF